MAQASSSHHTLSCGPGSILPSQHTRACAKARFWLFDNISMIPYVPMEKELPLLVKSKRFHRKDIWYVHCADAVTDAQPADYRKLGDSLTWKETLGLTALVAFNILLMLSAAFTGTVLFSMMILCPSITAELIDLAADSMYLRSAARPCILHSWDNWESRLMHYTMYKRKRSFRIHL